MFITDSNQQTAAGIEQRLCRRTDQTRVDAANVIPFPGTRSSDQFPENTRPRVFGLWLRRALRKAKDAALSVIRTPNKVRVQRKRAASITPAGHFPGRHQRTIQAHAGRRQVRMRVSA